MSPAAERPGSGLADLSRAIWTAERILRTEQRRDFDNRAVFGGLGRFAAQWQADHGGGPASSPLASLAHEIVTLLGGYDAKTREKREQQVVSALDALARARARLPQAESPGRDRTPQEASAPAPQVATPAPPSRRPSAPIGPARRGDLPLAPEASLEALRGVGPMRGRSLARLGLERVSDLLEHYPSRYVFHSPPRRATELFFQREASFEGVVQNVTVAPMPRGRLKRITARLADGTGSVEAVWIRSGAARPPVHEGQRVALSGPIASVGRVVVFQNPDWEPADDAPLHTRRITPVYPLTKGISDYWLRSLIARTVRALASSIPDSLTPSLRQRLNLLPRSEAVAAIHLPPDRTTLEAARSRLAFDELLTIQLVVLQRRARWQESEAPPIRVDTGALDQLVAAQPYTLTGAQQRVLGEIRRDLERKVPMTRLLQGEVGSGKTAVAACALFLASLEGGQGAIMAPTEILAEQHWATIEQFFERARETLVDAGHQPPRVALLTGSMAAKAKRAVLDEVAAGAVQVLVGTHAIIQERVEFQDLRLAVIDEQHRFGVQQRVTLRQKGRSHPHLLLMTATPIPRTLALSLYGDLDVSLIDEMPPGRRPVETTLVGPERRPEAYAQIRQETAAGHQAFVICPLVEDSAALEARSATAEFERLQEGELADLRLALLHGRMRPVEKDAVMRAFRDGEFDVLVSTSVVEVGVDIPNATVMAIEGAERFGLAQLHQFRGRVGRGGDQSTCFLLTEQPDPETVERLSVVVGSPNGLELAEHDLRLRGPGDYFGVRQSGFPELKVATLNDVQLVERARDVASEILRADPNLEEPGHELLASRVAAFLARAGVPS